MLRILALVFFVLPGQAHAVCDYYALGMWSYHWERKGHNETHNRVGCEGIAGTDFNLSYFRNSYDDHSAFLSKFWQGYRSANGDVSLGIEYGAVYGYGDRQVNLLGISPAILPRLSYTPGAVGFDIFLAYDEAVALSIKFKW